MSQNAGLAGGDARMLLSSVQLWWCPLPRVWPAFWALASPLHMQMALHCVRPSVSTKPAGAVHADWPLLALVSCSVLLSSSHLSLPMALCGPLSLVFQGGQSRQKIDMGPGSYSYW